MPLLVLLLLTLIVYAIYKSSIETTVLSNWHQLFDIQFSSQEFYLTVENLIRAKELPGVELGRITYHEEGLLSPRREYLRVKYRNYVFDICAAPFAKDFFVSWWHAELSNRIVDYFQGKTKINISGYRGRRKTYFQLDTENMLKESVKACVDIAVQQMTEQKGVRLHEGITASPN